MRMRVKALLCTFPVLPLIVCTASYGQYRLGARFQGSTYTQSQFAPPDTGGAVGPEHFVELINGRYGIYRKSDGGVVESGSLNQFFAQAGAAPIFFAFDPRVIYDAAAGRWFALAADDPGLANSFLFAVSASDDPTGDWTGFRIDSDANNDTTADFPLLGVSADGVFITANMYSLFTGDVNVTFVTIPKADLLLATPTVANLRRFENVSATGTGYTVQPVVDLDNTPMPHSLFSAFNLPSGFLKRSQFTGTIQSPSLSTSGGFVSVATATDPPDAPQPPMPTQKPPLDSGTARFGTSVVRRGGHLWAVTGVNVSGRAAIRWYRVDDATLAVRQTGTISHPTLSLYYPSIAVNPGLDVVIGCSGSSSAQPASCYAFVGRTTGLTTTFGAPILLRAGVDDYALLDGSERNRWGDYSATTVDPMDPSRFWTVQEFVSSDNVWAMHMSEIVVTDCLCDWNTDETVTSQDFFDFLGDFFGAPLRADFNSSGATDSQDFFDFLACFFDGCP
jgi:hypothetical protein